MESIRRSLQSSCRRRPRRSRRRRRICRSSCLNCVVQPPDFITTASSSRQRRVPSASFHSRCLSRRLFRAFRSWHLRLAFRSWSTTPCRWKLRGTVYNILSCMYGSYTRQYNAHTVNMYLRQIYEPLVLSYIYIVETRVLLL